MVLGLPVPVTAFVLRFRSQFLHVVKINIDCSSVSWHLIAKQLTPSHDVMFRRWSRRLRLGYSNREGARKFVCLPLLDSMKHPSSLNSSFGLIYNHKFAVGICEFRFNHG